MLRTVLTLALMTLIAPAPLDMDVGVPAGSPLDLLRIPVETLRPDVKTPSSEKKEGPGKTVAEDRLPRSFPALQRPFTRDFGGHIGWKPAPWQKGTPTPGSGKMEGYPPVVPQDLCWHCIAYVAMIYLHPAQVSPREITSFLIEIGEPAAFAVTWAKQEPRLAGLVDEVVGACGAVPAAAPSTTGLDQTEKTVLKELVLSHPYEDGFAKELLKLPDAVALPILIRFSRSTHRFLRRNAVFALRAYDSPKVLPELRKHLESADKIVRNRALAALIRWRDTEIVPWLCRKITDRDEAFATYALHALGRIGDRSAVRPILDAAKKRMHDWEFLWAAVPALGRIRDSSPDVIDFLKEARGRVSKFSDPKWNQWQMDQKGTRKKILEERIRIALARLGDAAQKEWARDARVHRVNNILLKEAGGGAYLKAQERREALTAWMRKEQQKLIRELQERKITAEEYQSKYMDLVKEYNRRLKEGDAAARRPKPKPKPPPPEPPEPEANPGDPDAKAENQNPRDILERNRSRLLEYSGVKTVYLDGDTLVIQAGSAEDLRDLNALLGKEIEGIPLRIVLAD